MTRDTQPKKAKAAMPGARGWRGHGRGSALYVQAADEWRATTVQACGLWPFAAGTGSPMIGVPLGRNLLSGATLCADPISWFRDAKLISNPSCFVLGLPGLGKALSTTTKIATPAGWSSMGELQVGDYVFDERGQPTPIVAVSEVMSDRACLQVRFCDESTIVADAEHLWVTQTPTDRQQPALRAYQGGLLRRGVGESEELERTLASCWGDHVVVDAQASEPITTRQMAATVRTGADRRLKHSIAVAPSLELPDVALAIEPRLLGLWLGDGHTRSACLTTAWAEERHSWHRAETWVGRLRSLGVLGDKRIPMVYLRASTAQRRALLSGLLDTAGSVHHDATVQYTTTSERLAHDVHELVCSLGYRAVARASLHGRDCAAKWTISFSTRDVVFGLKRKRAAHRQRVGAATDAQTSSRYVVDVRRVASVPVRCIQVASDSGMFLAGASFVATHNSSLVKRLALGLTGYGVMPLVLGDLKPDYVDLIAALGGQVIRLGRGRGHLNVLDPGEARAAAKRLTGQARDEVLGDARGRRHTMVCALITILRSSAPTDHEEMLLDRAIQVLDERSDEVPVLRDLIAVLEAAPEEVRHVAMDDGDITAYRKITRSLVISLKGLLGRGRVGEMFSEKTTTPMRRDVPVVFDVSSIDDTQTALQGAALMACWSYGFGAVNVAHALADAGLEPRRNFFAIVDEAWRALRAGQGMVDRMDALTRLNRQRGVGTAMISHTMSDLKALPDEADRMKARGFVERSGMVICGGLPRAEMEDLRAVVALSRAEQAMLVGWQAPAAWDSVAGAEADPPGRGNFLVKVGGRPGIPVHVALTATELALHDTNKLWRERSRIHAAAEFGDAA